MFAKSSLTLLNSDLPNNREPSALDNVLANYNMARVNTTPNGNCFFTAIAYSLENYIIPNQSVSSDVISHLEKLELVNGVNENGICYQLRKLIVEEWITQSDLYKPFLTGEETFETEAKLFLNDGHFATELGNSMPLAIANVLKLPVVVITQMENLPILPITPRESLQCMPIFIAFDHCDIGHYDAVSSIPNSKPSHESEISEKPADKPNNNADYCRCGQGAKKRNVDITSCDKFQKRCKCFQGVKGCTDKCQCLCCKNPYGNKIYGELKGNSTGSRKRRAPQMTTECMSGKEFMTKRSPSEGNLCKWTFLEELLLVQLLQCEFSSSDINMATIHVQYQQLVDNADIQTKTLQQVTGKVLAYLNDNEVYQTLFKEQIRLNWFM